MVFCLSFLPKPKGSNYCVGNSLSSHICLVLTRGYDVGLVGVNGSSWTFLRQIKILPDHIPAVIRSPPTIVSTVVDLILAFVDKTLKLCCGLNRIEFSRLDLSNLRI